MKDLIIKILVYMPLWLWNSMKKLHVLNFDTINLVEKFRVENFSKKLLQGFERECAKIAKKKKIMAITQGNYAYTVFNICYLNNILGLILYALCNGCIPDIQINNDSADENNNWDWYFKQPIYLGYFPACTYDTCKTQVCDIKHSPISISFGAIVSPDSNEYAIGKLLYSKFVVLNDKTVDYIDFETKQIPSFEEMVGAIIRGTDYSMLKPKGHPIQPDIQTLISEIKRKLIEYDVKYVYVATEEKRLFDQIADELGAVNVVSNKREYYDDIFYGNCCNLIGEVHFERENDNYWKGLEYLSSLTILSKCRCVIGGNCGGMVYAAYKANSISNVCILDCGLYA